MVIALYLICFILTMAAVCLLLKHRCAAGILQTLPLSALVVIAVDTLVGHVSSVIIAAASPLVLSVINLFDTGAIALFLYKNDALELDVLRNLRKPTKQAVAGIASYAIIAIFVALVAAVQFTPSLELNFSSTDPASQMYAAMGIVESGQLIGDSLNGYMFLAQYQAAIWIQLLSLYLEPIQLYQAFILSELLLYLLVSWLIWATISKVAGNGKHPIVSLILAILCIAGYPLNNLVFGFSYLGVGATYLCALCASCLIFNRLSAFVAVVQCVLLYGVFTSYLMFVPIALAFLLISWAYAYREKLQACKTISLPVIVAIVLGAIVAIVWAISSGAISHLATTGYSYNDFIGSFIPLIPAVVIGIVLMLCKELSAQPVPLIFFITCFAATALFLVLCLFHQVSEYYYFKFYFALWPAAFFVVACCFSTDQKGLTIVFRSYLAVWLFLFAYSVSGVENRISTSRPLLEQAPKVSSLFGVYEFNLQEMRTEQIQQQEIALWQEADKLSDECGQYVPMLGTNISVYWYEGTTHHRSEKGFRYYQYWLYGDEVRSTLLIGRLEEAPYVAVLENAELPEGVLDYLARHEMVFSNEAGSIYSLREVDTE